VAIIQKNVQLVDWLAEHVGSNQLQLIHRRPTFPMPQGGVNVTTEAGFFASNSSRLHIYNFHNWLYNLYELICCFCIFEQICQPTGSVDLIQCTRLIMKVLVSQYAD
jgi:hypothetical protein